MNLSGNVSARVLRLRTRWTAASSGPSAAGRVVLEARADRLAGVSLECERIGLDWRLRPADLAQRVLYCMGDYERPLRRFLVQNIGPADTVYDIGAHVGLLSVPLARALRDAGAGACLHSFEPTADSAEALRSNLERNGLAGIARLHEIALGREQGEATLRIDPSFGIEGSSLRSLYGEGAAGPVVRIERFDDWWRAAGCPPMDVVKIDVEGAEADVIAGMTEALEHCRPRLVVVELKDHLAGRAGRGTDAAVDALEAIGYRRCAPLSELIGMPQPMPWIDENVVFVPSERDAPTAPVSTGTPASGRARVDEKRTLDLRHRVVRAFLRRGGQSLLAHRRPRRWWLVYGPARCGTSYMALAIRANARLMVADWVLGPALQLPPELRQTRFDRDRARRDTSRNILANARLGAGGPLDLAYKQAWMDADEYEALVEMWGEPERKIFCYREPSGYMASAMKKFGSTLPVDVLQQRYIESLEVFPVIGGDRFEYHDRLVKSDYQSFLSPLVIPDDERFDFRYSGSSADDLVTPAMEAAYADFTRDRRSGLGPKESET